MVGNNTTQLSVYSTVFLFSAGIILGGRFFDVDFGIIGLISWLVFLTAILGFLSKIYYGD